MSVSPSDGALAASVSGDFFQAGSGKSIAAFLRVAGNLVVITEKETGALVISIPFDEIAISDRIAGIARRISLSNGAVFVTHDNDGVDRLVGTSMSDLSVNWLEKFHPRLIVIVGLAIALVIGAYRYGLPVAISAAVALTPNSAIELISSASLQGIESQLLRPSKVSLERQERLSAAFEDLVKHSDGRVASLSPQLRFHASPIGPNAFALPNGTIVVTDALLKIASDEAVIGVLGHELGHVHHQHGLRLLYRSIGFFALIQIIAGDVGGILEEVLIQGAGLLTLSYNREFERQADDYSVALMRASGRNPKAIKSFFEVMSEKLGRRESNFPDWLSTHPATKERIKRLEEIE